MTGVTFESILLHAINPALRLLPRAMDSDAARIELLAIGAQESGGFSFRFQKTGDPYVHGPANGFWQNERATVNLVMTNYATKDHALELCRTFKVAFDSSIVWSVIAANDVLAAGFARLILWADRKPLPLITATAQEGWDCYIRNWRPGKPHRERWDGYYAEAKAEVLS